MKKHLRTALIVSCTVMLVCSAVLLILGNVYYADSDYIQPGYELHVGSGNKAVLLSAESNTRTDWIVGLFSELGYSVLRVNSSDSAVLDYAVTLIRQHTTADSILFTAADIHGEGMVRYSMGSSVIPEGIVFISPTFDMKKAIDDGVYSCAYVGAFPTLIIGDTGNTFVSTDTLIDMYNLLSGDTLSPTGRPLESTKNGVTLLISPGAVIADGAPNPDFMTHLAGWMHNNLQVSEVIHGDVLLTVALFLMVIAGLSLPVFAVLLFMHVAERVNSKVISYAVITTYLKSPTLFLLSRLATWVPAVILTAVLYTVMTVASLPYTAFGKLFIAFLMSASASVLLFYRLGLTPGMEGKPTDTASPLKVSAVVHSFGVTAVVMAVTVALGYSGFYAFSVDGERLVIFAVLFLLFALLFTVFDHDYTVAVTGRLSVSTALVVFVIPYLPLLILVGLPVLLGNLPMAIAMLKCVVNFVIAVLIGRTVYCICSSSLYSSICSALFMASFLAFYSYV